MNELNNQQTITIRKSTLFKIIAALAIFFVIYTQLNKEEPVNEPISSSYTSYESSTESSTTKPMLPTVKTLSTGTYKVGTDIAPGIYNLTAQSGTGLITGDLQEGYLSEMMGIMEDYEEYYSETYKNLYLKRGDKFEISGGVTIEFVPIG